MESKDILNRISKMEEELAGLKKSLTAEKLPYNAWYKSEYGAIAYFTNETNAYGTNWTKTWKERGDWGALNDGVWSPATNSEVEAVLIKEAEKRGYKEGVSFLSVEGYYSTSSPCDGRFKFDAKNNCLYSRGMSVFKDGKWAEIIKDDKIMIGGHEVLFSVLGGIDINNKHYSREDVFAARKVLEWGGKISVGFSHQYNLDLETVNKILNKL